MPYTLPPITLTQNHLSLVTIPGSLGSISYLKLVNASPYLLSITNLLGGSDYMQPGEANVWPVPGLTSAVQVTPLPFIVTPNVIPSSVLVVTWFLEGEQPTGNYPVNFNVLNYVGNNVQVNNAATTIEQDLLTPFVYGASSLVATKNSLSPNQLDVSAGIAFPQQSDGSLLRTAVAQTHFLTILASTTYLLDLNPDGSWSWTTSHSAQPNYLAIAQVTTDGSGNILTVTDERVMATVLLAGMSNNPSAPGVQLYNLHVTKDIQADDQISVQGIYKVTSGATGNGYTVYIGSNDALYFMPTGSTQNQGAVFYYWVPGMGALPIFSLIQQVGLVSIDANGVIHAPAPVQLIGGYQLTGKLGMQSVASGGGQVFGQAANFILTLTNTPTSLTLTPDFAPGNCSTPSVGNISINGFNWTTTSTAAGSFFWFGKYTTVGNCLLDVDSEGRTIQHHCDSCGHVGLISFDALRHDSVGAQAALSVACPSCGAVEAFNTQLTSADEADTTPQGSGAYATTRGAQATLVRQLMTALGLEVAA